MTDDERAALETSYQVLCAEERALETRKAELHGAYQAAAKPYHEVLVALARVEREKYQISDALYPSPQEKVGAEGVTGG